MSKEIPILTIQLVAVISVLVCGVFDTLLPALAPIAVISLYTRRGLQVNEKDATEIVLSNLESSADQMYFVGYLSTIAAFAGIVLRILITGKIPDDPRPIFLMVEVALLTTVVGLMAMTNLKNHVRKLRQNSLPMEQETEAVSGQIEGSSPQLIEISNKAAKTIEKLNEQLEQLKYMVNQGTDSVQQFNKNIKQIESSLGIFCQSLDLKFKGIVDQGTDSVQQFNKNVKQIQSILDDFVRVLEKRLVLEAQRDTERVKRVI